MQHNGTGSPEAAPAAPPMAEPPNAVGSAEPDAGASPQGAGSSLQGAGSSLQGAGSSLQGAGSSPQGAGSSLQGAGSSLQGAGASPQGAGSSLQGAGSSLQGAGSSLQGAGASPQGAGSSLQGAGASPQPVAPTGQRRSTNFTANASIERRLLAAQLAIDGALADEAQQAALDACGYDMAQLQQGKLLYEQALALCQERHATLGDRLTATDARDQIQEQAHVLYMRHVVIARVAFRGNRGVAEKLNLAARKRTHAGWLLQARQFYTNALGDESIIGRLAQYRLTQDQLIEGQRQVSMVADEAVTRQSHKTVAKATKKSRDAALDALNQWMRDFRAIARIALADQPQASKRLRS